MLLLFESGEEHRAELMRQPHDVMRRLNIAAGTQLAAELLRIPEPCLDRKQRLERLAGMAEIGKARILARAHVEPFLPLGQILRPVVMLVDADLIDKRI